MCVPTVQITFVCPLCPCVRESAICPLVGAPMAVANAWHTQGESEGKPLMGVCVGECEYNWRIDNECRKSDFDFNWISIWKSGILGNGSAKSRMNLNTNWNRNWIYCLWDSYQGSHWRIFKNLLGESVVEKSLSVSQLATSLDSVATFAFAIAIGMAIAFPLDHKCIFQAIFYTEENNKKINLIFVIFNSKIRR